MGEGVRVAGGGGIIERGEGGDCGVGGVNGVEERRGVMDVLSREGGRV